MSNITINPKLSAQQRQQLGEYLEFAKPRTIEEANRIGQQYLKDMARGSEEKFYLNPLGYVTPKAKSRKGVLAKVIMSCQDCHKTYPVIEVPGEGSFSKTKCPFCKGKKVAFEKAYRCDIHGRILDNPRPTGFVLDSSKTKAGAAARIAELKKQGIEAIAQPVKYTNGRQTWVVWRKEGVPMYRKNPKEFEDSPALSDVYDATLKGKWLSTDQISERAGIDPVLTTYLLKDLRQMSLVVSKTGSGIDIWTPGKVILWKRTAKKVMNPFSPNEV